MIDQFSTSPSPPSKPHQPTVTATAAGKYKLSCAQAEITAEVFSFFQRIRQWFSTRDSPVSASNITLQTKTGDKVAFKADALFAAVVAGNKPGEGVSPEKNYEITAEKNYVITKCLDLWTKDADSLSKHIIDGSLLKLAVNHSELFSQDHINSLMGLDTPEAYTLLWEFYNSRPDPLKGLSPEEKNMVTAEKNYVIRKCLDLWTKDADSLSKHVHDGSLLNLAANHPDLFFQSHITSLIALNTPEAHILLGQFYNSPRDLLKEYIWKEGLQSNQKETRKRTLEALTKAAPLAESIPDLFQKPIDEWVKGLDSDQEETRDKAVIALKQVAPLAKHMPDLFQKRIDEWVKGLDSDQEETRDKAVIVLKQVAPHLAREAPSFFKEHIDKLIAYFVCDPESPQGAAALQILNELKRAPSSVHNFSVEPILKLLTTLPPGEWTQKNLGVCEVCISSLRSNPSVIDSVANIFKIISKNKRNAALITPLVNFLGKFSSNPETLGPVSAHAIAKFLEDISKQLPKEQQNAEHLCIILNSLDKLSEWHSKYINQGNTKHLENIFSIITTFFKELPENVRSSELVEHVIISSVNLCSPEYISAVEKLSHYNRKFGTFPLQHNARIFKLLPEHEQTVPNCISCIKHLCIKHLNATKWADKYASSFFSKLHENHPEACSLELLEPLKGLLESLFSKYKDHPQSQKTAKLIEDDIESTVKLFGKLPPGEQTVAFLRKLLELPPSYTSDHIDLFEFFLAEERTLQNFKDCIVPLQSTDSVIYFATDIFKQIPSAFRQIPEGKKTTLLITPLIKFLDKCPSDFKERKFISNNTAEFLKEIFDRLPENEKNAEHLCILLELLDTLSTPHSLNSIMATYRYFYAFFSDLPQKTFSITLLKPLKSFLGSLPSDPRTITTAITSIINLFKNLPQDKQTVNSLKELLSLSSSHVAVISSTITEVSFPPEKVPEVTAWLCDKKNQDQAPNPQVESLLQSLFRANNDLRISTLQYYSDLMNAAPSNEPKFLLAKSIADDILHPRFPDAFLLRNGDRTTMHEYNSLHATAQKFKEAYTRFDRLTKKSTKIFKEFKEEINTELKKNSQKELLPFGEIGGWRISTRVIRQNAPYKPVSVRELKASLGSLPTHQEMADLFNGLTTPARSAAAAAFGVFDTSRTPLKDIVDGCINDSHHIIPLFKELTSTDDTTLSADAVQFAVLMKYILSLDDTAPPDGLSLREETSLKLLYSIQSCPTGKKEGIYTFYAELIRSGNLKGYTLDSQEKAPLLHQLIQLTLGGCFTDSLVRDICEMDKNAEVSQGVHQTLFLRNCLGPRVGLTDPISPDTLPNNILKQLLFLLFSEDFQTKAVETLGRHFTPDLLIEKLQERLDPLLESYRNQLKIIEDAETEIDNLMENDPGIKSISDRMKGLHDNERGVVAEIEALRKNLEEAPTQAETKEKPGETIKRIEIEIANLEKKAAIRDLEKKAVTIKTLKASLGKEKEKKISSNNAIKAAEIKKQEAEAAHAKAVKELYKYGWEPRAQVGDSKSEALNLLVKHKYIEDKAISG